MLVGKPGLDGYSNGAEQIAVAARDSGIEVVYEGSCLPPPASPTPRWRRESTSLASPSCPARTCRW